MLFFVLENDVHHCLLPWLENDVIYCDTELYSASIF